MAIATTDGMPIRYYYISPISSTANSITLTIKADSVSGSISNAQVFVNLDTYFNNYYVDFSTLFTELGADWSILYITDGGTSIPVKVEKWDEVNNKARLWVTIPVLTSASKDIVLEFDNTIVTTNDLITDMTVSGMIIPTPDPTNNFFLTLPSGAQYLYSMSRDLSTDKMLFGSDEDSTILSMLPEQEILSNECTVGDGTNLSVIFKIGSTIFHGYQKDGTAYYDTETFTLGACTALISTETPEVIFENIEGFSRYTYYTVSGIIADYNSTTLLSVASDSVSGGTNHYIFTSTDGINWARAYLYFDQVEIGEPVTLPNGNSVIGGMLLSRNDARYETYKVYTCDSTYTTFTYRGIKVNTFVGYSGKPSVVHGYGHDLYYFNDKLISHWNNDEYGTPDYQEASVIMFSNYGTTFMHHMNPPSGIWADYDTYVQYYEYDKLSDTLFAILSSDTVDSLYKTNDLGLTWDLVSSLHPVEYNYFQIDFTDYKTTSSFDTRIMQLFNGYLYILVTDGLAQVNDGDSYNRIDCILSFKLSDIVDPPTGENLTDLDSLVTSPLIGAYGIAIKGSVAYVAGATSDYFVSIDISDPENLVQLDSYTNIFTTDGARNVAILGTVAYLTSVNNDAITSIDISDPENLVELDTYSSSNLDGAVGISIFNNIAYVSSDNARTLTAIDISDPENLVERDSYYNALLLDCYWVEVSDGIAYITSDYYDKLFSIDVSDPDNLVELDIFASVALNGPRGLAIANNVAYVACSDTDLITSIDISDPANLTELDSYTSLSLNGARKVAIVGDVAFVTSYIADSITSIDISDPSNLSEIDTFTSTALNQANGIAILGNVAYIASGTANSITSIDIT